MNTKILQKILEELNKGAPSIDYMKGMVETLMEISGQSPVINNIKEQHVTDKVKELVRTESVSDEEIALEKYNSGATGRITG